MPVSPILPGRVPETYQFQRLGSALNKINAESIRYQEMASSGVRIGVGSDDPGGAIRAGLMQRGIERNEALQEQLAVADSQLAATDTGLAAFADAVSEARGLLQGGIGAQASRAEKDALAEEVAALRQSVILEGNRTFRGRALFGGSAPTDAAFVDLGEGRTLYTGDLGGVPGLIGDHAPIDTAVNGHAALQVLTPAESRPLAPALTLDTPLAALHGGVGVVPGELTVTLERRGGEHGGAHRRPRRRPHRGRPANPSRSRLRRRPPVAVRRLHADRRRLAVLRAPRRRGDGGGDDRGRARRPHRAGSGACAEPRRGRARRIGRGGALAAGHAVHPAVGPKRRGGGGPRRRTADRAGGRGRGGRPLRRRDRRRGAGGDQTANRGGRRARPRRPDRRRHGDRDSRAGQRRGLRDRRERRDDGGGPRRLHPAGVDPAGRTERRRGRSRRPDPVRPRPADDHPPRRDRRERGSVGGGHDRGRARHAERRRPRRADGPAERRGQRDHAGRFAGSGAPGGRGAAGGGGVGPLPRPGDRGDGGAGGRRSPGRSITPAAPAACRTC